MSFLRLDDTFDTHPKLLLLKTDERRWTWQRILLYSCRHRSDLVPEDIREAVPRASRKFLLEAVEIGLLDVDDHGKLRIHDWKIYNADTIEDRVNAYLASKPGASANEVQRAVGGNRAVVLGLLNQYRNGSEPVPPPVPKRTTSDGSLHTRALPSQASTSKAAAVLDNPREEPAAALTDALNRIGIRDPGLRVAAQQDPERALACAVAAESRATTNPAGLFRTLLESGETPAAPPLVRSGTNLAGASSLARVEAMVRNGSIGSLLDLAGELDALPAVSVEDRSRLEAMVKP